MFELNAQMHEDLMKSAVGVFGLIQDSTSLKSVFDINDALRNTEAMQACVDYLQSIPEVAALIDERYVAPQPDMPALLQLPPESLGYQYASMLTNAGFDPNFYRVVPTTEVLDYIRLRVRQTHDIWHIVTGWGTDELGELALQAFGFAQMHYPSAILILVAGVMSAIKHPEDLDQRVQTIYQGYEMGRQVGPFLGQKWEAAWEKPVTQWRSELQVKVA
ncbi:Coq4 family protein [Thermosynechococcaceae cyanobacterium BACA0444]|uniref:Coq4 family protein n=1 Tax=Pseudocalidococcus azoricus BACA0444 TaxID=2918990 RepID=A0AAE4JZN8_9CYAN|nr:Coq4 family protein [Pseudocalidococcus azoricus]MDS3862349.1 Coq4 family protein [Pseudocalidococcus azoricus BACA0444]